MRLDHGDDEGLGLIEIMISMLLLATLLVAFLPVLVQGLATSVRNSIVATGNQIVNQQLDALRTVGPDCASVSAFDDGILAPTTDARGTVFQPIREVAACPATYPGVVSVRVWVTENGEAYALTDAVTLFYVDSLVPAP